MSDREHDHDSTAAMLTDALDGVLVAARYAELIGEDEIAMQLGSLYQDLALASPSEHWTPIEELEIEELEIDAGGDA